MKYFDVREYKLVGQVVVGEVDSEGEWLDLGDTIYGEEETSLYYEVREWGEDGHTIDQKIYKIHDNADEVLAKIEAEHPAGEWQNNAW